MNKETRPYIEVEQLVKTTYFEIATWHNEEADQISLKHLSLKLVNDILSEAFKQIGMESELEISMDLETRRLVEQERMKKQSGSTKDVNNMSDEELLREIEKRKLK